MATDSALMAHSTANTGVWRWYSWSAPTVSFGRNERVLGRFSEESLKAAGLEAVRRPTGGRALLHSRELTYSVTFKLDREFGWHDAYDAINRVLCRSLNAIGIDVALATAQAPVKPDGPVCFDLPAEGELVVQGRKLVGSAVWRHGTQYLQHGSILLHDDQSLLSTAACSSVSLPPAPPAASLSALGMQLSANQLQESLTKELEHELLSAFRSNSALPTTQHTQSSTVTTFEPSRELLRDIEIQRHSYVDKQTLWRR